LKRAYERGGLFVRGAASLIPSKTHYQYHPGIKKEEETD